MRCPSCKEPPLIEFPSQAWCGNDDCPILSWNPQCTMDELLDGLQVVDLQDLGRRDG